MCIRDRNSNVVVTGIITATRFSGQITPTSLEIGSNIKLGNAGVITATSFVGSGANLTSLPAQVTIANNAVNRVITGGSGTNLNGEATLTLANSALGLQTTGAPYILVGSTNAGGASLVLDGDSNGDASGTDYAYLTHNTDGDLDIVVDNPANAGNIKFFTNSSTERLRIASDGKITVAANGDIRFTNGTWTGEVAGKIQQNSNNLYIQGGTGGIRFRHASSGVNQFSMTNGGNFEITNGDLVVASGHGIAFSATANSSGTTGSEVLADYEKGTFTPRFLENGTTDSSYAWRYGQYVKVGNIVHVHLAFGLSGLSGNFTTAFIGGLPFNMVSQHGTNDFSYVQLIGYSYASGYGDSGNTTQLSMELNQTHGTMMRVVQGQSKGNVNQSSIGGGQRLAFQFSYPAS